MYWVVKQSLSVDTFWRMVRMSETLMDKQHSHFVLVTWNKEMKEVFDASGKLKAPMPLYLIARAETSDSISTVKDSFAYYGMQADLDMRMTLGDPIPLAKGHVLLRFMVTPKGE